MPQPIGSQRKNTAQRLQKGDIRHLVATGVKQVSEAAMICLHAALVCREHVAHEDDRGMGNQSIEITALDFLGQFQVLFGYLEKYL